MDACILGGGLNKSLSVNPAPWLQPLDSSTKKSQEGLWPLRRELHDAGVGHEVGDAVEVVLGDSGAWNT